MAIDAISHTSFYPRIPSFIHSSNQSTPFQPMPSYIHSNSLRTILAPSCLNCLVCPGSPCSPAKEHRTINRAQPQAMRGITSVVSPDRETKKMCSPSPPQPDAEPCISAASPPHPTAKPVPPCIVVASDTATIKSRPCSFCHQTQVTPPVTRCKECNKVCQRVILCKNQLNEGLG